MCAGNEMKSVRTNIHIKFTERTNVLLGIGNVEFAFPIPIKWLKMRTVHDIHQRHSEKVSELYLKNTYLFSVDFLWQNPSARNTYESWKVIRKKHLVKRGLRPQQEITEQLASL